MVNLDKKTAIAKFRDLDTKIDNIEGGGSAATWATLEGKPATFPPATHTHDDRYYQKSEVEGLIPDVPAAPTWATLSGKPATFPPAEHDHDDRYYQKSEGVAVARHGSNPAMARPVGNVVWWIGSVEPANALAHDVWDDSEVAL